MPTLTLSLTRLRTFGARIVDVRLAADVDDTTAAALRTALAEHRLLILPDQHLDIDGLGRVARLFGPDVLPADPAEPTALAAAATAAAAAPGPASGTPAGRPGADGWSLDRSFLPAPPATVLASVAATPPAGAANPAPLGGIELADLAAAYDELSPPLRRLVSGLVAEHRGGDAGTARHPLVRVHPATGRRSLFVSPATTTRIVGLPGAEDDVVLALLAATATLADHTVRHDWQPGDLVVWDNRSVAHRTAPAAGDADRSGDGNGLTPVVHRLAVADPVPVAAARRLAAHPYQY